MLKILGNDLTLLDYVAAVLANYNQIIWAALLRINQVYSNYNILLIITVYYTFHESKMFAKEINYKMLH